MRAIIAVALLLMLGAGGAAAAEPGADQPRQPTCRPPDQLAAYLAAEFRETLLATGIAGDGTLLLIFQSKGGATFTIAKVTARARVACVVDFGTELQIKPEGQGT